MKNLKTIITLLLVMMVGSSQAQIFDKIKEAASQSAEKKTKSKTSDKAANRNADYKGMGYGKKQSRCFPSAGCL